MLRSSSQITDCEGEVFDNFEGIEVTLVGWWTVLEAQFVTRQIAVSVALTMGGIRRYMCWYTSSGDEQWSLAQRQVTASPRLAVQPEAGASWTVYKTGGRWPDVWGSLAMAVCRSFMVVSPVGGAERDVLFRCSITDGNYSMLKTFPLCQTDPKPLTDAVVPSGIVPNSLEHDLPW
jgi:hypothetical protein